VGVYVADAALVADGLRVLGTEPQTCGARSEDDAEPCAPGGFGLGSYDGATVDVANFVVSASALCGVQVARGGAMDLHAGEVAWSPVGANVDSPAPDFDLTRLADHVDYHDNERPLDSSRLPVPEAGRSPIPSGAGAGAGG